MATAFTRTMRSLRADRFRSSLGVLLLATALLVGWTVWLLYARVARYETTDSARLEVARAIQVIQAPYAGKVVASHLVLGAQVQAGDVLLELDANPERLQIQEERARRNVLDPQLESLNAEIEAALQARAREQEASHTALEEARARIREAEASARFTASDVGRYKQLFELGIGAERDYARAQSEAQRASANVESLQQTVARLEQEQRTRESDRDARIRSLQTAISRLEGEKTTTTAALDRLEYDVEKRRIRAPASGRLGEVATLHAGAVLHEGDRIGAIVPAGTLKIVAEFPPAAALGRIRPGQAARLRLKGFPWAQYGSISARVATVANEIRDGSVRVECELASQVSTPIPEEHGLPGSIEVEVERISPVRLALRAAGELLTAPRGFSSAAP
jgi:multidrug resistance efflux pump